MPTCCPCPDSEPSTLSNPHSGPRGGVRRPTEVEMSLHELGPTALTAMAPAPSVFHSAGPSSMTNVAPSPMSFHSSSSGPRAMHSGSAKGKLGQVPAGSVLDQAWGTVRTLWQQPVVRFGALLAVGYVLIGSGALKTERRR